MSEGKAEKGGLMSTGEFTRRLGLQRYQLLHLIETGQVEDARLRVGGRRLFSQEEALEAADYLRQRQQLAAARKGVRVNETA